MSGSTNFLVFNENLTNTEDDINYLSDTARINGITSGMASSRTHNKTFRQATIMASALAQFIANTNNNASDSNFTNLLTALTNAIASKNDLNTWALNKTIVDIGTANNYKISTGFSYTALYTGMIVKFITTSANTGASVINVDNLGNISLVKNISTALVTGDITASQTITAIYDGTNFEIIPDYSILVANLDTSFTAHLADNVKHITSTERTLWNTSNKRRQLGVRI